MNDKTTQSLSPMLNKLWKILIKFPLSSLGLIIVLQTLFAINNRNLWYSDEVRYANIFTNLLKQHHWFVLYLNGIPYPDKPPLFFWMLALLHTIFKEPSVFFISALLSGCAVLLSTNIYSKAMKYPANINITAPLILLSSCLFLFLLNYFRMDLLFTFFIVLSQMYIFKSITQTTENQNRYIYIAAICIVCAVLTKGPLGFLFPIFTLITYLSWRGEINKLKNKIYLYGLGIIATFISLWLIIVWMDVGSSFINNLLFKQTIARAVNTFHHKAPLYYYLITLPLAWIPWSILVILPLSQNCLQKKFWQSIWKNRKNRDTRYQARTWLWCSILANLILLSCLSGKVFIYVLPLLIPLAILTADYLFSCNQTRLPNIWLAIGLLFFSLGSTISICMLLNKVIPPINGFWDSAILLIIGGIIIILFRRYPLKTQIVLMSLFTFCMTQVLFQRIEPQLNTRMSTKNIGDLMKQYITKNYVPIAFGTYPGIFSYYANHNIRETHDPIILYQWLHTYPKSIIVARTRSWQKIKLPLGSFHSLLNTKVADLTFTVGTFEKQREH